MLIFLKLIISIPAYLIDRKNRKVKPDESKKGNKEKEQEKSEKRTSKTKKYFSWTIKKLDHLLTLSLIIPLANSFSLKLLIGNWVSFYSLHKLSIYNLASLIILVLTLLYNIGIIILAFYSYGRLQRNVKEPTKDIKNNIFISIFDALCNISRARNVSYSIFITASDLIFSFILVFGYNVPFIQLAISSILLMIRIGMIIALQPLKILKQNILEFINTFS